MIFNTFSRTLSGESRLFNSKGETMKEKKNSTQSVGMAAKNFNRRALLKRGAALAALTPTAPMFVKNAFAATSGEVNVLMWGEYLPDSILADFKAKTGITVNHTKIGDNGEIIAKMKAGGGAGFDLASPTNMRALQWENLGVLAPFCLLYTSPSPRD